MVLIGSYNAMAPYKHKAIAGMLTYHRLNLYGKYIYKTNIWWMLSNSPSKLAPGYHGRQFGILWHIYRQAADALASIILIRITEKYSKRVYYWRNTSVSTIIWQNDVNKINIIGFIQNVFDFGSIPSSWK